MHPSSDSTKLEILSKESNYLNQVGDGGSPRKNRLPFLKGGLCSQAKRSRFWEEPKWNVSWNKMWFYDAAGFEILQSRPRLLEPTQSPEAVLSSSPWAKVSSLRFFRGRRSEVGGRLLEAAASPLRDQCGVKGSEPGFPALTPLASMIDTCGLTRVPDGDTWGALWANVGGTPEPKDQACPTGARPDLPLPFCPATSPTSEATVGPGPHQPLRCATGTPINGHRGLVLPPVPSTSWEVTSRVGKNRSFTRAATSGMELALWVGLGTVVATPHPPRALPARPGPDVSPAQRQTPRNPIRFAALHFFNFRASSPSALRMLTAVHEGSVWVNPKNDCKVDLVFTTERYNPEDGEERVGKCSAQVFFRNEKPRPAVNVTCTRFIDKKRRQMEDYQLYKQMKQLKSPLDTVSIPDSHGYIDPNLRPIWNLAFLGSSYVMWDRTTQLSHYSMAQISRVKQWSTSNDAVDFDYNVLLHEFSTQEIIPCRIHLVWYPGKPLKVKYHCQELQTTEEASATEEGSAMALTDLSNL
ncbi:PREDICTED: retinoic acid receptor responder protein 1 [Condylura cristata]|uniref:retinoic acid receptor responder protein 1 n=1 Tax=Condylura cristata TaxID=143302 RepID=UPI000642B1FB|nr:PREDICTED: retinoic acid receptor responder protein 1 [Condylura cristata]